MPLATIQIRRDTTAAWSAANPILAVGELGLETNSGRFKIGNGINSWSSLPYATVLSSELASALQRANHTGTQTISTIDGLQIALDLKAPIANPTFTGTVSGITKSMVGLGNVDNTSDANKPVSTAQAAANTATQNAAAADATTKANAAQAYAMQRSNHTGTQSIGTIDGLQNALDNKSSSTHTHDDRYYTESEINTLLAGKQPSGSYATLIDGIIPSSQLPGFVDGVLEFANFASLPSTGEISKIYITLNTNKTYRWSGSTYIEINPSPGNTDAIPEGNINKYYTDNRASLAAPVQSVASKTGTVILTKSDVGLTNVDNTSDANKPVSTAQQAALNLKAPISNPTFTGTVSGITKSMVGLGNVDNTSDANKPVSTAQQSALDTKAPIANPTFTGTVSGITKSMVGLGNVDNTSDANKPVSTAQAAANTAVQNAAAADATTKANAAQAAAASDATAKANSVQAYAIQRSNHTGTQAISTISGLQSALDSKVSIISDNTYTSPTQPPIQGQIAFTTNPQSRTVLQGAATFSATAINTVAPVFYQWEILTHGDSDFQPLPANSPYSGTQTSTLVISPVSSSVHLASFRLKVTDSLGRTEYSSAATLFTASLSITRQPRSISIKETGEDYNVVTSVRIGITGGVPPYSTQWQTRTGPTAAWTDIPGKTLLTLRSVSAILGENESVKSTDYRAKVTDAAGSITYSQTCTITITAEAPEIIIDPSNATVSAGVATFTADYKGKGAVAFWERKRVIDANFSAFGAVPTVSSVSSTVSRTTLTITNLTPNDTGTQYRVRVSSLSGEDYSSAASVAFASAPIIGVQPTSQTIIQNNPVTFSVSATFAGGSPTYQWQELVAGQTVWTNLPGATSSSLTISSQNVYTGRSGSQFRVLVTGAGLVATSDPATLTIIETQAAGDAVFTLLPSNASIETGSSYNLRAATTWLQTTDHYALIIVRYDDGSIEYHPLSNGILRSEYRGSVPRFFDAPNASSTEYSAILNLAKSAFVSVAVSTQSPLYYTISGTTAQSPPWISYAGPVGTPIAYRAGVIAGPVANRPWAGGITAQYPVLPPGYVESTRARVEVLPRRAFIGPVPTTGFWNPPTSEQFVGAATTNGMNVVAFGLDGIYGSYLHSADGGNTWATRNLPFGADVDDVFCVNNIFYVRLTESSSLVTEADAKAMSNSGAYYSMFNGVLRPSAGSATGTQTSQNLRGWHRFLTSSDGGLSFSVVYAPRPWQSYANGRWFYITIQLKGEEPTIRKGESREPISYLLSSASSFSGTPSAQTILHPWQYYYNPFDFRSGLPGFYKQRQIPLLTPRVRYAHGRYYVGIFHSTNGTSWATMGQVPMANGLPPTDYAEVTLPDTSQNYVLADNGFFAPAGTVDFSPVTQNLPGSGPQIGDYLYFGSQAQNIVAGGRIGSTGAIVGSEGLTPFIGKAGWVVLPFTAGLGMNFYRKPANNVGAAERLFGHTLWVPNATPPWGDVQIMSYKFGQPFGPNLDTTKWGIQNIPGIGGVILLPDRMIHIFRAKQGLPSAPTSRFPVAPRAR